ncbi:hypothetical protein PR048_031312 [Dryococelus australis]|uniref:Uncharacterized protein n=1 Tax=Dryococelus australis TaxID=614101 RepID=A0ABQ9G4W6_9NEOP|nr:hypothetical protein PR048_031312 [Dryococelus australis]
MRPSVHGGAYFQTLRFVNRNAHSYDAQRLSRCDPPYVRRAADPVTLSMVTVIVIKVAERFGRHLTSMSSEPMRVIEVSMEQCRNEGAGEAGDPREDPQTNGIVRQHSFMRKSGVTRPGIQPGSPWWEPRSTRRNKVCPTSFNIQRRPTTRTRTAQLHFKHGNDVKQISLPPPAPGINDDYDSRCTSTPGASSVASDSMPELLENLFSEKAPSRNDPDSVTTPKQTISVQGTIQPLKDEVERKAVGWMTLAGDNRAHAATTRLSRAGARYFWYSLPVRGQDSGVSFCPPPPFARPLNPPAPREYAGSTPHEHYLTKRQPSCLRRGWRDQLRPSAGYWRHFNMFCSVTRLGRSPGVRQLSRRDLAGSQQQRRKKPETSEKTRLPTSVIVRHDSHSRKLRELPGWDRTLLALAGGKLHTYRLFTVKAWRLEATKQFMGATVWPLGAFCNDTRENTDHGEQSTQDTRADADNVRTRLPRFLTWDAQIHSLLKGDGALDVRGRVVRITRALLCLKRRKYLTQVGGLLDANSWPTCMKKEEPVYRVRVIDSRSVLEFQKLLRLPQSPNKNPKEHFKDVAGIALKILHLQIAGNCGRQKKKMLSTRNGSTSLHKCFIPLCNRCRDVLLHFAGLEDGLRDTGPVSDDFLLVSVLYTVYSRFLRTFRIKPFKNHPTYDPLVHKVFDTSWRTLAQSSLSTVTADNQCVYLRDFKRSNTCKRVHKEPEKHTKNNEHDTLVRSRDFSRTGLCSGIQVSVDAVVSHRTRPMEKVQLNSECA